MSSPPPASSSRLILASAAGLGSFVAVLFWPAGTFDWLAGWLYMALFIANLIVTAVYLERVNPELVAHRLRLGKGTKVWDLVWAAFFAPVFMSVYVVAGFDAVRFQWSAMPGWLWLFGLPLFLAGSALLIRSMGVNPFFEKTVRIQTERGHRVIDTGPYRYVRHPGYLGFFGWILSTPLLLGSWWAFVPALLSLIGMLIRTALEDRTLHKELDGYAAYAQRVRYRLIPGLW